MFHEQDKSIDLKDFKILDKKLQKYFPEEGNTKVHAGPIIRREFEFKNLDIKDRQHIINAMLTFTYNIPISYTTIVVDKRKSDTEDKMWLQSQIVKQLNRIRNTNYSKFCFYNKIQ